MNTFYKILILLCALVSGLSCTQLSEQAPLAFEKLTINTTENPIVIEGLTPDFGWIVTSDSLNKFQSAYRILLSTNPEELKEQKARFWDSGKINSSQSVQVEYNGPNLNFATTYYWKVQLWDEKGIPSTWSKIQEFSTGLAPDAWNKSEWISVPKDTRTSQHRFRNYQTNKMAEGKAVSSFPTGYFRNTFVTDRKIKKAKAYISGLGYYELYLNGEKIGDHVLDPAPSNYDKKALYVVLDATDYIQNGKNAIGLILGNGFYGQNLAFIGERESQSQMEYGVPAVKMILDITYEDGSQNTIVTDESWTALNGPIVFDNVYSGEVYDARFEIEDWNTVEYHDEDAPKAKVLQSPVVGALVPQVMPAIKKLKTLAPKEIFRADNGNWIIDFGQNIAGWVEITVKEKTGQRIDLQLTEALKRNGKTIHLGATGGGASGFSQQLTYVCKSDTVETWEPRFTYHGFQYAEISGLSTKPEPDDFKAILVATDIEETGSFISNSELLNKMNEVSKWTIMANLHGIPEDCPQREKCGWLGDAHAWAEYGLYNYDINNFYEKYMQDIRTQFRPAQGNNDTTMFEVPTMIAPGKRTSHIAKLDWGIATIYLPWYSYLHKGNTRMLNTYYEDMKQLTNYYLSFKNEEGIIKNGMGDWCPPRWDRRNNPGAMECDPVISATAYFYDILKIMKKIAELEDDQNFAHQLSTEIDALKHAFNKTYLNNIAGTPYKWYGSQTATVMALQFELVNNIDLEQVLGGLLYDINTVNEGHHTTGIHGNRYLYSVLSKYGKTNEAFNVLTHPDFPSQAFIVNYGFTTWPERQWDWKSGVELNNSLNHPMHSGFAAYFYETLAGIKPNDMAPGYKKFFVDPVFPRNINEVNSTISTPYGIIENNWEYSGDNFKMTLRVPFNTTAILPLDSEKMKNILINGEDWRSMQNNTTTATGLELGSGKYSISYTYDKK